MSKAYDLPELCPGDILSYSAGSTQLGPDGFRKLGQGKNLLTETIKRWPDIENILGHRPILFINAYPATIGRFSAGIQVDTYLSPRVMSRALQLGYYADHPVILLGQPLFVADALRRHVAANLRLPKTLLLWLGGYVMTASLEEMIHQMVSPHLDQCVFVHYYGTAEVDAGCMMARERNQNGKLIYHPREDVKIHLEGEKLLLTLYGNDGCVVMDEFDTGDLAKLSNDGYNIWNPRRLHPQVEHCLDGWTTDDWDRRTGYVQRCEDGIYMQLREGVKAEQDFECEFYQFGHRFGFSWLNKPFWR